MLKERNIDFIVLAGYLAILTDELIDAYPNKIMNIHPSLIPSFCGPGYYGMHVHEKVLARGVKVTGAKVHYVNKENNIKLNILSFYPLQTFLNYGIIILILQQRRCITERKLCYITSFFV